jgi:hypothetical protein
MCCCSLLLYGKYHLNDDDVSPFLFCFFLSPLNNKTAKNDWNLFDSTFLKTLHNKQPNLLLRRRHRSFVRNPNSFLLMSLFFINDRKFIT